MAIIEVNQLYKTFRVHKKEPGLWNSLKSLVSRNYQTIEAVKQISFQIEEGELVGFIGPNGAGKTTTLKMLSGLLYPTGGTARVLGYIPWERHNSYRRQFSLVMGNKNQLWWDLPAIESFLVNKEIYGITNNEYHSLLDELVTMLEVKEKLKVPVRELSLGERMKLELIAALLHSPKVLFLDEPTIGLDVISQKKVRDFVRDYNRRKKTTIILTSHYIGDIQELCHRVIIIDHGRIIFDGALETIVNQVADYKLVTIDFAYRITKEELEPFGEIVQIHDSRAIMKIKRTDTTRVSAQLLSQFEINDIDIEEEPIEDIIRSVLSGDKTIRDPTDSIPASP
ncbi:MAG: ABC transporter ATP-binding protein [bacterium]|nr:ABC transporter ATP-binding protein [bacterium]